MSTFRVKGCGRPDTTIKEFRVRIRNPNIHEADPFVTLGTVRAVTRDEALAKAKLAHPKHAGEVKVQGARGEVRARINRKQARTQKPVRESQPQASLAA